MRILLLTNLYPPHAVGGYEERCRQVVDRLAARGHTLHLLVGDYQKPGLGAVPEETPPGVTVARTLRLHGYLDRPWLPLRQLLAVERQNQRVLRTALAEFAPDVVHVWNLGGVSKSLCWTLARQRVPVVYDVSDHWVARSLRADAWLAAWNRPRAWWKALPVALARALRLPDVLAAPASPPDRLPWPHTYFCSAFLRDFTARAGWPVQQGRVIYCAVEAAAYAPKTTFAPPRRFFFAGRLAPDKNPLAAVEGVAQARRELGLDLTLDVYGRGDPAYVDSLRAAGGPWLRLTSAKATEMPGLYQHYDALIFTSNWGEPFALTPLEAMAAHLPVLLYPDGGDAELLRDGENAIGLAASSGPAVAAGIARLCALPDAGATLAATARRELLARFDWAAVLPQIEQALDGARTGRWAT